MRYAIVEYPIKEELSKSGLIAQTNLTARINNSKTKCIVSYNDSYSHIFRGYPTLPEDELLDYINKNSKEWDPETVIEQKIDIEGRQVVASAPFSDTGGFFFRGKGMAGVAAAATVVDDVVIPTTTFVDYKLTEDRHINGVRLLLKNHTIEDSVYFEIIDEDFDFAGILYSATPFEYGIPVPVETPWSAVVPTGLPLNRFGEDWYLAEDGDQGRELLKYPSALKKNMTIRIIYKTYSTTDVVVKCNLYLHEKR